MSIRKIQTGDKVKVISGKYKGIVGTITKVEKKLRPGKLPQFRGAVSTVPKIIKFRKKNVAYNLPGEQLEVDRLIDLSNIALVTSNGEVSKVKIEEKDGKKVRIFKKTMEVVALNYTSKKSLLKKDEPKDTKETTKKSK